MTAPLTLETVPVDSLTLDPDNARTHGDENLAAIRSSLERFGQVKPLVVTADGVVLAGNGTLRAALELGWRKVQVTRVPAEWSREQGMAYAIADNRTGELAEWDSEVLASQLVDLDSVGWDLRDLGFPGMEPPTDPGPGPAPGPQDDRLLRCPSCGFQFQDVKGDQA